MLGRRQLEALQALGRRSQGALLREVPRQERRLAERRRAVNSRACALTVRRLTNRPEARVRPSAALACCTWL